MKGFFVLALTLLSAVVFAQDMPATAKLTQTVGVPLETHIGGQVFKLTRTSPLQNVFGRADIFGRTVDRGSVELRYQGQTPDGKTVLRLIDIDVRSNETTMNRARVGVTSVTGSATYSPGTNTATVDGTAITVVGQEGRNEMLPPNTTEFALDPQKKKELRLGLVTVTILDADETSIRYTLSFEPKTQ